MSNNYLFRYKKTKNITQIVSNTTNDKDSYAMLNINNSQLLWQILKNNNITMVYGLPGGGITNILNYLPSDIKWINVGHELQNGFLASVYGYYTNNVGVLFTTYGPGIATALSAFKNAEDENLPLLLISTIIPNSSPDDFQYWDIINIGNKIGKTYYIENVYEMEQKFMEAYNTAKHSSIGVMIIINYHILLQPAYSNKYSVNTNSINANNYIINIKRYYDNIITDITRTMSQTKILIILGKGKFINYTTLINFIQKNNLPYVTVWKQRLEIPNTCYCGRLGTLGHHSANYAAYNATHILIIGDLSGSLRSSFYSGKFTAVLFNKNANIYTLVNRKIDTSFYSKQTYIVNSFEYILQNLNFTANSNWIRFLNTSNSKLLIDLPAISQLEKYCYAASNVYKKNNLNIPVTTGVGNHWYAIGKYMNIPCENSFESSTNWASIGIGIVNGIGLYHALKKKCMGI